MTVFSQKAFVGAWGFALLGQLYPPTYLPFPDRPADVAAWGEKKYAMSFVKRPRPGVIVMYGTNSAGSLVLDVYVYVLKGGGYRLKSAYFARHGFPKVRATKDALLITYTRDRCVDTVKLSAGEG